MGTNIRSVISKNNSYYISKHKYYELYHFCLQYSEWEKELLELDYSTVKSKTESLNVNYISDPVADRVIKRNILETKINIVKNTCKEVSGIYYKYLFKGITEGKSYVWLKTNMQIPCCKETYYTIYRKFFYELTRKNIIL